MNAMSAGSVGQLGEPDGGPMWGRFFDSIGQDDTESVMSESRIPTNPSMQHPSHLEQSPHSEVHPDDSASVGGDEPVSALEGYSRKKGVAISSLTSPPPPVLPVDDGTYVFKFRSPSGRTHRFQARHDDVGHLRDIVSGKLSTDPFFTEFKPWDESSTRPDPLDFHLSYTDADGDTVLITSDHDVTDAVKIARATNLDRVVLIVQGGKAWQEATEGPRVTQGAVNVADAVPPTEAEVKPEEPEKVGVEPGTTPASTRPPSRSRIASDHVLGIPQELLLPASIGVLALAIVGVFTISRLTSSNY
jgi:hypothetical protein